MKRFYKLLCAVAAIGLVGCTTDVTEDAAVVVPSEGSVKTLTVALDGQTRIELGEKTAEAIAKRIMPVRCFMPTPDVALSA